MNKNEALEFISALTEHMNENGLDEISVKLSEISVEMKKNSTTPQIVTAQMPVTQIAENISNENSESKAVPSGKTIDSPIIGTFYSAPAPDKPAFINIGSTVNNGDVVCIVESMKLMNEVTADISGIIEEILVQNGDVVEFGQPLFRLK